MREFVIWIVQMGQHERAGDMRGKIEQWRIVHNPDRQQDYCGKNHKKTNRNESPFIFPGCVEMDRLVVGHGFLAPCTSYDALRKTRATIHQPQATSEFLPSAARPKSNARTSADFLPS